MGILINALIFCCTFLILLGLSLWPVLFRKYHRRKLVLILANVVFIVALFGVASSVATNRTALIQKQLAFFDNLSFAAENLQAAETPDPKYPLIPESERDAEKVLKSALDIGDCFRSHYQLTHAAAIPAAPVNAPAEKKGAPEK